MTDSYSEALEKVIDKEDTVNNKMKKFNKIHDKIKYEAFGKVTIGKKIKKHRDGNNNTTIIGAQELFEEEVKRMEEEIKDIKNMK